VSPWVEPGSVYNEEYHLPGPAVAAWTITYLALDQALGYLGKDIGPGIIEHAR
jgi:hypothetical protein